MTTGRYKHRCGRSTDRERNRRLAVLQHSRTRFAASSSRYVFLFLYGTVRCANFSWGGGVMFRLSATTVVKQQSSDEIYCSGNSSFSRSVRRSHSIVSQSLLRLFILSLVIVKRLDRPFPPPIFPSSNPVRYNLLAFNPDRVTRSVQRVRILYRSVWSGLKNSNVQKREYSRKKETGSRRQVLRWQSDTGGLPVKLRASRDNNEALIIQTSHETIHNSYQNESR
jgi:hypothetical protein